MKTIKRRQAVPPVQKDTARAAKLTKISSEQTVVEHLQAAVAGIERLPLLTGRLGCQFLDCLELTDKFRTRYGDRVKQLLSKSPDAIPDWHVSEIPQRTLSRDTAKVFDAISAAEDGLTPEQFLEACSTNLTAVRKLLAERNPHLSPDEIEHVLNCVFSNLISYEAVTRLSRSKGKQIELSL